MAGYSGTPLAKKLGFKPGSRVLTKQAPRHYGTLVSDRPSDVKISARLRGVVDICHFFTRSAAELEKELPPLIKRIEPDGALWISWPKKSSGVAADVTEDTIRSVALPLGLVDVKVCAVDEVWSALKLVIRKELRSGSGR